MAEFGFESNEDYEFQLRALFAAPHGTCARLARGGESGRRKTAFANALARALEYPHILYHDFSAPEPPPAPIVAHAQTEPGAATRSAAARVRARRDRGVRVQRGRAHGADPRPAAGRGIPDQIRPVPLPADAASGRCRAARAREREAPARGADLRGSRCTTRSRRSATACGPTRSGGRFERRPEDFGLGSDARAAVRGARDAVRGARQRADAERVRRASSTTCSRPRAHRRAAAPHAVRLDGARRPRALFSNALAPQSATAIARVERVSRARGSRARGERPAVGLSARLLEARDWRSLSQRVCGGGGSGPWPAHGLCASMRSKSRTSVTLSLTRPWAAPLPPRASGQTRPQGGSKARR